MESQQIGLPLCNQILGSINKRDGGIWPQTQKCENSSSLIVPLTVKKFFYSHKEAVVCCKRHHSYGRVIWLTDFKHKAFRVIHFIIISIDFIFHLPFLPLRGMIVPFQVFSEYNESTTGRAQTYFSSSTKVNSFLNLSEILSVHSFLSESLDAALSWIH